ncbi:hypothetical protein [Allorhizocola rhizosphaerae]|uniref:hypothetical protein n=1 Tax=Allorhizocola rhizosphaerae TaxID=1872709 RepID=UPI0013C32B80|nr:hypothetical protein [Allorhizocola rhizosphaerae]
MNQLAVGDESMRHRGGGPGIYVMAAPFFDQAYAPDLRAAMNDLRHGKRPFHWYEADPRDRRRAVEMLCGLDSLHIVVVGGGLDTARQERGRRLGFGSCCGRYRKWA